MDTVWVSVVLLILLAAALPAGGVALWAQALTGCLCLLLALGVRLPPRPRQPACRLPGAWWFRGLVLWVGVLALLQVERALTTGEAGALFTLSTTLFIWCAWCCLTVSSMQLSGRTAAGRALLTGVATLASAQSLFAVAGLYAPGGFYGRFAAGGRAVGTFSSGNSLGGFLALSLPVTLMMAQLSVNRSWRHIQVRRFRILHAATREDYCLLSSVAWLLALLLQSVALLLSGSRGGMLAAAVAMTLLLAWIFYRRLDGRLELPGAAVLLGVLLVLAIGAGGTYAVALQRIKALQTVQTVALPRTDIWEGALRLVARQPLGVGPGGFPSAYPRYQPEGFGGARVYHAHNDYLELLVETGVPGLVLLILATGTLLTAAARRLLVATPGESVWCRRAALLSVGAGLLHAVVDFNLSSRPGVSALFFCLLGLAVSRAPREPADAERGGQPRCTPWIRVRRVAVVLVCAVLAVNQLRLGTATVLAEQGFAAVNGSASLYFWLPPPALTPSQAVARLQAARRLAPESVAIHLMAARTLVAVSDQRLERMMAVARASHPEGAGMDLAGQMRILMRMDERDVLRQARAVVDRALRLAPEDPDATAQAVLLTARITALTSREEREFTVSAGRVLAGIRRARLLAPNDATVHRLLLDSLDRLYPALADIEHARWQAVVKDAALDIGWHLLHIGGGAAGILDVWGRMAVDPFAVSDSRLPLPAPAAWALYRLYDQRYQAAAALQALDALEERIRGPVRDTGTARETREADRLRYMPLLTRERARWALRQQRFDDYRRAFADREEALRLEVRHLTGRPGTHRAVGRYWRYTHLKELFDTRGLDPEHTHELATLASRYSGRENAAAGVLASLGPFPGLDASVAPDHRLEMQLLGGRIEWIGLSVEARALRTYWRFRADVPSDLQAVFVYLDDHYQPVATAAFRFTRAFGTAFGAGAPLPGAVLHTATPIPVAGAGAAHLRIGLRRLSTRRWLPSTEGLSYGEIYHWEALRQVPGGELKTQVDETPQ